MTQIIKPNDLVYIPHLDTCVFIVRYDSHDGLYVQDGFKAFTFEDDGKLDPDNKTPLVYLATPANKEKLEAFYGIILDDIPADEEVEKFTEALNKLSNFHNRLNAFNSKLITSDERKELHSLKSNLIRMFQERGTK